jgi:quinoprotein glucose dehydrogenase
MNAIARSALRLAAFFLCAWPAVLPAGSLPDAATALRTIAEEAATLEKGRLRAKQKALARLGAHPDREADGLLLAQWERLRDGTLPAALWLDLFEASARRDNAQLKALVAERERSLEKLRDPLLRFSECLEGGDGEAGREIFFKKAEAGCVRCHAMDGEGGRIGPELTWLRHSIERIRLLESLITPNSTIATGFQSAVLTLKSGETIAGVVNSESRDEITLTAIADGKQRTVKSDDVSERAPMPSPMPPHFGAVLSKHEIRDLIEFLAAGD